MTKTIKIITIITSVVLAITVALSFLGLTACQKTSNAESYVLRAEVVTVGEVEHDVKNLPPILSQGGGDHLHDLRIASDDA